MDQFDLIWKSKKTRQLWEKKLWSTLTLISQMEVDSVESKIRTCAWKFMSAKDLKGFTEFCKQRSLIVTPVKWQGAQQKFLHYATPGRDSVMCVVARSTRSTIEFIKAFKAKDNKRQGELLGYPVCCQNEFSKTWEAGFFDPILQVALNTPGVKTISKNVISLKAHPWSNPILRYIGLSAGFHIPCSFQCQKTIKAMEKIADLVSEENIAFWDGLKDVLNLPTTCEILRGAITVTNPMFQFNSSTIETKNSYTIQINKD